MSDMQDDSVDEMDMLYVLPFGFMMADTSYPEPVLTKLISPQVVAKAPDAAMADVASAKPIWVFSWKATICLAPGARAMDRIGVVGATQEPRLASASANLPVREKALFQIMTVRDFPEVLMNSLVKL